MEHGQEATSCNKSLYISLLLFEFHLCIIIITIHVYVRLNINILTDNNVNDSAASEFLLALSSS